MLGPDDDIDELIGAEVFLGVDGHTGEDGRLTVSAVAMNRDRLYVAAQFGGTAGLLAWLQRPRHRQHVTFLAIGVDLTRSGQLIARDLEAARYAVIGHDIGDMAAASQGFYVDLADGRIARHGGRRRPGRGDALDAAVEMARRKPLGEEVGQRFVYTTYSRDNDISPLIALVLANALSAAPVSQPWAEWEMGEPGPEIQRIGGVYFPTHGDH